MKLTTFLGENLNPDCIGCYVGDETNFQQRVFEVLAKMRQYFAKN